MTTDTAAPHPRPEVEARIKELLPPEDYTPPPAINYCKLTFTPKSTNQSINHARANRLIAASYTKTSRRKAARTALDWIKASGLPTETIEGVGACNGPKIKRPGRTVERAITPVFDKIMVSVRVWFANEKSDLLNIDIKPIFDGLVDSRIIPDDNVRVIQNVNFTCHGITKDNPRVEIHIYRVD